MAALKGHQQICKILLENQAEKNPTTNNGSMPLHIAAREGHLNVCKTLVEGGVKHIPENDNGKTPLNLAALRSHYKVTLFLSEFVEEKEFQDKLMKWLSE